MSEQINLKQLERRAYRSIFQDGLWDLYLAGLMASLGILGIIPGIRDETWTWLIGYTALVGSIMVLFILGKKYITVPRLGAVTFGQKRKHRKLILTVILSLAVLFNIGLVLLTAGVINAPAWLQRFSDDLTRQGRMDVFVPLFAGLFVTVVMSLIAYFLEFNRGMYIALLFGLGIFIDLYFDFPLIMLLFAALAAIPGLIMFIRFIRQYPIKPGKVENDTNKAS